MTPAGLAQREPLAILGRDNRLCCATDDGRACTCQAVYVVEMRPGCSCGGITIHYLVCIVHEEVTRTQRWECRTCRYPAPYVRTTPVSEGVPPVTLGTLHV